VIRWVVLGLLSFSNLVLGRKGSRGLWSYSPTVDSTCSCSSSTKDSSTHHLTVLRLVYLQTAHLFITKRSFRSIIIHSSFCAFLVKRAFYSFISNSSSLTYHSFSSRVYHQIFILSVDHILLLSFITDDPLAMGPSIIKPATMRLISSSPPTTPPITSVSLTDSKH
jgi:hypothetical protein